MADIEPQQISQDDPRSVAVAALFIGSGDGQFLGNVTLLSRNLAVTTSEVVNAALAKADIRRIEPLELFLSFLRYQPTPQFYPLPVKIQEVDSELGFGVLSFSGDLPVPISPDLLGDGEIPPPKTVCDALFYEEKAQVLMQVSGLVSNRSDSRFRLRLDPNAKTPQVGAAVLQGNQVVGIVTSVPPAAFESNSLSDPFPFVEVLGLLAMAESLATAAVRNLLPWIKGDANPLTGFPADRSVFGTSNAPTANDSTSNTAQSEASPVTEEQKVTLPTPFVEVDQRKGTTKGTVAESFDAANFFSRLSVPGANALAAADAMRNIEHRDEIQLEYLIVGLFDKANSSTHRLLRNSPLDSLNLRKIILETTGLQIPEYYKSNVLTALPHVSKDVHTALIAAEEVAGPVGQIRSRHLLYGALSVPECRLVSVLNKHGIRAEDVRLGSGPEDNTAVSLEESAEPLEPIPPIPPPFGGKMPFPGYTDLPAVNPTPKVASDLWCEKDSLGYEAYARTIASLITHEETKPPLTIGIKAPWGAGKTSLMKRVQHLLDGYAGLAKEGKVGILQDVLPTQVTLRELLQELKDSTKPSGPSLVESKEGKAYGLPPRITVWFNAWKYQTSEQIWAGMAHCIISQVTARMGMKDRELFWLRLHARRVNVEEVRKKVYGALLRKLVPMALLVIAVCAIAFWIAAVLPIGLPWRYAIRVVPLILGGYKLTREWSTKLGEKAAETVRDLIREPNYEGKMGYLHLVESDIRDVLQLATESSMTKENQDGDPLVVFVDDLDRCAPNKVAEVVEAINLFLCGDYPNCIFVLGMEPGMVAAALEVANKDVIEKAEKLGLVDRTVPLGWRFMEKIVQLPIMIPPPTKGGRETYVRSLTGAYEADVQFAKISAELAAGPQPKPEPVNMAGILPTQPNVLAKAMQDVVKAQELERTPLNEDDIKKYAEGMKGRTLAEVQAKSEKILADVEPEKRRAAAEASKRVYAQTFSERDPAMGEFVKKIVELMDGNPRQIKRYVNVFRFYSTLRHSLGVDGITAATDLPDDVLAKFVALSIRWPHAVDCLRGKKAQPEGTKEQAISRLQFLESESKKLTGDSAEVEAAWKNIVGTVGSGLDWAETREFREFLSREPSLCEKDGHGLW